MISDHKLINISFNLFFVMKKIAVVNRGKVIIIIIKYYRLSHDVVT